MEISEVRVRLVDTNSGDRLKAVCTVTMDETFVVRDVKVVEGSHGPFVAMPSRKLSVPCPKCRTQNHLRAKFCNECGKNLPSPRIPSDDEGREKVHRDIAHPITASFRQILQESVLEAYEAELGGREEEDDRIVDEVEEEVEEVVEDEVEDEVEGNVRDDLEEDEVEEEEDDNRGNVSEYDAIIADLRGDRERFVRNRDGSKSSDRSNEKRSSREPRRRDGNRGRSERGSRKRDDRKPAARQPQRTPPPRNEEPPSEAAKPEPAEPLTPNPVPVAVPAPVDRDVFDDQDGFAAGLVDSKPRESSKPVETPKRIEEPAPLESVDQAFEETSESDESNDTGFGAGLL